MNLRVEPCGDSHAVNRVLHHPSIAAKIRHDGREPGYIDHPAVRYWGAWQAGALVGVFVEIRFSRWEVEVHAAILPHAVRYGRDLARLFMARVFGDADVERITAYVLGTLPSAANFCRKLGFEYEGLRRSACRIGGDLSDVLIFGVTRQDWVLRANPS